MKFTPARRAGEKCGPIVTSAVEAMWEMAGGQGPEGTNHIHFRKLEYFVKKKKNAELTLILSSE